MWALKTRFLTIKITFFLIWNKFQCMCHFQVSVLLVHMKANCCYRNVNLGKHTYSYHNVQQPTHPPPMALHLILPLVLKKVTLVNNYYILTTITLELSQFPHYVSPRWWYYSVGLEYKNVQWFPKIHHMN